MSSAGPIVVMKFGGTSVATADGRALLARRVQEQLEAGKRPVVVVSAMGRRGAPYATDTLLDLVAERSVSPRERDLLASVGETISAVVVASELRAAGVDAEAFSGAEAGIFTDGTHGNATVTEVRPGAVLSALARGAVPVVAGFQGVGPDGSVTTLGRGGSDTTACALGIALAADSVEIYTDVDGVMTADPRSCSEASVLTVIRSDELHQMAQHGSRVVHTPAAELAAASGIEVRVKNTYSDHPGTLVADIASYQPRSVATAVSHIRGVARFTVDLSAPSGSHEHTRAQTLVFEAMADASVSLDMFTPAGGRLLFTVASADVPVASDALERLGRSFTVEQPLAKVTLIGAGMHGVPGVMARVARCLDDAGVPILQAADSHTTISVLVPDEMADAAVRALHAGFRLGDDR
ncbi:aspartokinase [Coriobacteriaceae bacterium EMTCatB1]|nr:aspartokinase [Coriobacteriaceae bacterium EMTCatB1]